MSVHVAGAILAGGRARKMGGADKGLLERAPGQTIAGHLSEALTGAGVTEVIVNANHPAAYGGLGKPVVPDRRPGLGPLAGVEATLAYAADGRTNGGADGVLFVPCDLPAMSAATLRRLLRAFEDAPTGVKVAHVPGGIPPWHPLCCVVATDLLPGVQAALDAGHLKVLRLWQDLGVTPVVFDDPQPFWNVNSPEDLEAWRKKRSAGT